MPVIGYLLLYVFLLINYLLIKKMLHISLLVLKIVNGHGWTTKIKVEYIDKMCMT